MKDNIYFSFEQNPEALEKLLATGNAELTHTQDKGKWGKEFPKILMEVRKELKKDTSSFRKATKEETTKYAGSSNDLSFYRPGETTSAMQVKVSLQGDFLKLLEADHIDGERIGTLERLNEMIQNQNWLNINRHREMITMVGVRIPVQGLNSMEFKEIKEFLPIESGGIIIPPTEIVTKAGADFDVDKMTTMMANIALVGGKPKLYNATTTTKTEFELKNKQTELKESRKSLHQRYDTIFNERSKNGEFTFTEEQKEEIDN
jgi:hypothetical protein